jgi:hypothetical protein
MLERAGETAELGLMAHPHMLASPQRMHFKESQLERSQKVQQILLILRPQTEELSHDSVRL